MVFERWDPSAKVSFDARVLTELRSLRFITEHKNALIVGPVGVGKSFLANALGYLACRHRYHALFFRADEVLRRLTCRSVSGDDRLSVGADDASETLDITTELGHAPPRPTDLPGPIILKTDWSHLGEHRQTVNEFTNSLHCDASYPTMTSKRFEWKASPLGTL